MWRCNGVLIDELPEKTRNGNVIKDDIDVLYSTRLRLLLDRIRKAALKMIGKTRNMNLW